jgi:hypothetical protein
MADSPGVHGYGADIWGARQMSLNSFTCGTGVSLMRVEQGLDPTRRLLLPPLGG